MSPCARIAAAPPLPLIEIRHGYAAHCHHLNLSVETGGSGWTAQVRDQRDGRTLYSASRCNAGAAKVAIAEYAMFAQARAAARTPEELARQLEWKAYW